MHESVDVLIPRYSKLVKGGLLAHPVGSGKTVIAAELIGQTLTKGLTVVFVPGHIVKEWEKEAICALNQCISHPEFLELQLLNSGGLYICHIYVAILPHNLAPRMEFSDAYPFRIIIDEPQDIISNSEIFEVLLKIDSPCRWLLTATPNPLGKIMQLSLGYQESLVHKLPAIPCCLGLLAAGAGEIPPISASQSPNCTSTCALSPCFGRRPQY